MEPCPVFQNTVEGQFDVSFVDECQKREGSAQVFAPRAARPGGISILAGDANQQDGRSFFVVKPAKEVVINVAFPGGIFCKFIPRPVGVFPKSFTALMFFL